ncbi:MAG: lysophospholipid acyltransferase family protein [Roseiarcus sp.]
MLKRLGRMRLVQEALGFLLAAYIRLVRRTNRFVIEPADLDGAIAGHTPLIVAMWHGQHFMISFAWPRSIARMAALISRHGDGGVNAAALRHLGVAPIRGSGARSPRKRHRRGASAMREMLRALSSGASVAMTADVPKRARVAGSGIVLLARLSGRPIAPTAVVTSRRFDFASWDRASLGKPFGRGAVVVGELIHVASDADEQAMERARKAVEEGLDAVHARAYAKVGAVDPGAGLRRG